MTDEELEAHCIKLSSPDAIKRMERSVRPQLRKAYKADAGILLRPKRCRDYDVVVGEESD